MKQYSLLKCDNGMEVKKQTVLVLGEEGLRYLRVKAWDAYLLYSNGSATARESEKHKQMLNLGGGTKVFTETFF